MTAHIRIGQLLSGSLLVVTVIAAFGALPRFIGAWADNRWSLDYLKDKTGERTGDAALPVPPRGHASAALWLARDALAAGNPQAALLYLQPVSGSIDPGMLRLLGEAREAAGDLAGAVDAWQRAGDASSLWAAAGRAGKAKLPAEALLAYRAAAFVEPVAGTQPLADFLQWSERDPAASQAVLEQALASFPQSPNRSEWLSRLGDVLRAQKRWAEATGTYQQALNIDADLVSAHIGLGWVFFDGLNDAGAAEAEFRRAIEGKQDRGDGFAALADLLMRQKRYAEAEARYAQAVERNPNNRWWAYSRANAVRAEGDASRALALYQEIVDRFPDFGEAYFDLALQQEASGVLDAAALSMDNALEFMVGPIAWHFDQAGRVYAATAEWGRAAAAYRRALALDPSDPVAIEGLRRAEAMLVGAPTGQ